jgi:acetyl-CoA C-acetyltransferase
VRRDRRRHAGVPIDDPRPLTVTGALPYHGGPGNNYVTHSIACMVDRLRAKPGSRGLVTGLGWYLTKRGGVTRARRRRTPSPASSTYQKTVDAEPHPAGCRRRAATVESYTVTHDATATRVIVVARLARPPLLGEPDGPRRPAPHRARRVHRRRRQVRHHASTQTNVFEP